MNQFTTFGEPELPLDLDHAASATVAADEAMLYVALVDGRLQPRAGLRVTIEGGTLRLSVMTDSRGVLFLDSCPAGGYTISAGELAAVVHTLSHADARRSKEPYLSVLR